VVIGNSVLTNLASALALNNLKKKKLMFAVVAELPLDVRLCEMVGEDEQVHSAFDQLATLLLHDLTSLALPIFDKVRLSHYSFICPKGYPSLQATCLMRPVSFWPSAAQSL
jgi:hypothetical protein